MEPLRIETERLTIVPFTERMAESVCRNSLDRDNREFLPDEVFETPADALDTIRFLRGCYDGEGPQVYPVLLHDGTQIGHVQAVPLRDGTWEIGYHIGAAFTGKGYATEAVRAFLPVILHRLGINRIWGICRADNPASQTVLKRCGFALQYDGPGLHHGTTRAICRYLYQLEA
jgi:RimJ/RimL family protein N-acetyltransferase